jgi:hypothetical protein
VTFSDSRNPHLTTNGHELALSVVFESGLQHFADSPEAYRALPPEAIAFLKAVPAAWDVSKLLAGEPGKFVVVGRRKGTDWYIAGISGLEVSQTVKLDLTILGPGQHKLATIGDGDLPRRLLIGGEGLVLNEASLKEWTVTLQPRGGFVARVVK